MFTIIKINKILKKSLNKIKFKNLNTQLITILPDFYVTCSKYKVRLFCFTMFDRSLHLYSLSQYSTVVLTVVRVMIAKYRK